MTRRATVRCALRLASVRQFSRPSWSHTKLACQTAPWTPCRSVSTSTARREHASTEGARKTHFGYETVLETEKARRVAEVFSKVAETYDRMNDLMSFGWHRIWKDHFVSSLDPGYMPSSRIQDPAKNPSVHILDIAGGTGDIAFRHLRHAHTINNNPNVHVTISDINPEMLAVGQQRASLQLPASQQAALSFLEANAERLDTVPDNSVDLYTVAFGIRNFTNIPLALREAHRVLKPGGVFACLEFSKVDIAASSLATGILDGVYKRWSFGAIPLIGEVVAGDRDSYQYLVESIERFPSQRQFRDMIRDAGFEVGVENMHDADSTQGWENLSGGIAAIHKGMKPLPSR